MREADGGLELTGAAVVEGGGDYTVPAPIDELPMLARAGAILPLLPADVDTLSPYTAPGAISLQDRRNDLRLLAFPRGWSSARIHTGERVVSSEKRRRRWVMRIEGKQRRRYTVEAALGTLRRPFRPCRIRANRRPVRFTYDRSTSVLRFTATGRRIRIETRACRR